MTEVVVQIRADQTDDVLSLSNALDAFAKWIMESGSNNDSGDQPHIMMMTDHSAGDSGKRLVFQDRGQAAQFLNFWRQQKQQLDRPA